MSDSMVGNRKFRTFNVMDDFSRETLAIEVGTNRTLQRIIEKNKKTVHLIFIG